MNGPVDPTLDGHSLPAKPRLLLAEDDPALRQLLGEMLHDEYDLTVAPDGERAWEAARSAQFDLVISDVEMPGLDGIELTRRLRAQFHTAAVPILLLSANNRPTIILQALEANADDFLLKPFRPQELLARTRHRLRLCEMRRELLARVRDGAVDGTAVDGTTDRIVVDGVAGGVALDGAAMDGVAVDGTSGAAHLPG